MDAAHRGRPHPKRHKHNLSVWETLLNSLSGCYGGKPHWKSAILLRLPPASALRTCRMWKKKKKIITHYSLVGLFILCSSCPCFDMYLLLFLQCLKALVAVLISALHIFRTAVIYDVQSLILSRQQWRQFGIRRIGADMCKIKERQKWDVIGCAVLE